jgi:hypothetical protein
MRKVLLILLFLCPYCYTQAYIISNPTDYFRSVQSGDWGTLTTWESSADNATWAAATLIPASAANTISIRNGHTVTISTNQDMDQVVIESGGILLYAGGVLTVNDDASGDDIIIQNGGVFTLALAASPPVFFLLTASVNINTGGILRVSATGLTSASPAPGVNTSNYIYQHASMLEYTPNLAFASSGVTFFPNADAVTIPIFKTTGNLGLIGGASPTVINGVFEAGGTITFQNAGTKTFRNGINGVGNITSDPACGKFIINGAAAILGGIGSLTLPVSGMDIGPTATVTVLSSKTVTGNIALLTNSFINLGNFNLTMVGDVTGGSATSHIVTNGLGKLILNNVGAVTRTFPLGAGAATYNPIKLQNGGGLNYGIRVEAGINPAIAVPVKAVNRTWHITPTGGTPGTVNVNFFYSAGHGNAGFNYLANLELGHYTSVWNVVQTGLVPSGAYQVSTTVSTLANNIEAPLVLANIGAILALENSIAVNYFTGIKQNGRHLLKWKLTCNSTPAVTIFLQRSTNGIDFETIFSEQATAVRCLQPFEYNDAQPANGVNYYRIKMMNADGKVTYSTIVPLINANAGIDILNITPNPVTAEQFNLKISAARQQLLEIFITDLAGRAIQYKKIDVIAGFNIIPVNILSLPNGTYQLHANTADGQAKILRFVVEH